MELFFVQVLSEVYDILILQFFFIYMRIIFGIPHVESDPHPNLPSLSLTKLSIKNYLQTVVYLAHCSISLVIFLSVIEKYQ